MTVLELAILALAVLGVLGAFSAIGIPRLPVGDPDPATDEHEALEKLAALQAEDGERIAEPCRTRLLRPDGEPRGTLIVWHGFTNCPSQFAEVAEELRAAGFVVLLPRMPRHGDRDVLSREIANITAEEVVTFAHHCVDIAAGLPRPISAVGLSAGGALAAWAGATRPEIERIVSLSPFIAPKGVPLALGRLVVRLHRFVPTTYVWWDPLKKTDLGECPPAYPGFPLRAIVPFMHLGESLHDGHTMPSHRLRRVVLVTNPGDFLIRRDAARTTIARMFSGHAEEVRELTISKDVGWWHDFVDQRAMNHGEAEQVAVIVLSALDESSDPAAVGVIASSTVLAASSMLD